MSVKTMNVRVYVTLENIAVLGGIVEVCAGPALLLSLDRY